MEIYPAESRLVDEANQFHLWVLSGPGARIPIGFSQRRVTECMDHGSRQRPWDDDVRPPDLLGPVELKEMLDARMDSHFNVGGVGETETCPFCGFEKFRVGVCLTCNQPGEL